MFMWRQTNVHVGKREKDYTKRDVRVKWNLSFTLHQANSCTNLCFVALYGTPNACTCNPEQGQVCLLSLFIISMLAVF